jgi:hypothetical protein
VAKTITVTGIDDHLDDGDITYTVITAPSVSIDVNYNNLNAADVLVTNLDNDTPPVGVDDTYIVNTITENPLVVSSANGVLKNDSDADGDPLTAILENGPSNGILDLKPDGSFSYTWTGSGDVGTDSFTYKVNDGYLEDTNITVDLIIDLDPPAIPEWVEPRKKGETLVVTPGFLTLRASITGDDIQRLEYLRWDHVDIKWVLIGSSQTPPYEVVLNTNTLPMGPNQVFVRSYDQAGNPSPWDQDNKIILQKDFISNGLFLYLPMIHK